MAITHSEIEDETDNLIRILDHYPNLDSKIKVGGDSVYTGYPKLRVMLQILRYAKMGLEYEALNNRLKRIQTLAKEM